MLGESGFFREYLITGAALQRLLVLMEKLGVVQEAFLQSELFAAHVAGVAQVCGDPVSLHEPLL